MGHNGLDSFGVAAQGEVITDRNFGHVSLTSLRGLALYRAASVKDAIDTVVYGITEGRASLGEPLEIR